MTTAELTLAAAARMIREAVKDRSYRATPLGLDVARYYRWKKNEWGATAETLRDYEAILARLALYFADLELRCLGATADDTLDDLFPGSGVMGETFEWFCRQGTLAIPKARNAAGARAEANRLRRTHDPLPGFDSPASVPEGAEFYRKVETA